MKKIYEDSSSPAVRKVGTALETIFDLSNTLLLPLKLLNEKTKLWFTNNLKKYEKKLDQIPEEKIVLVRPEIGIPIFERLTYSSNEELTDLFTNLLASASNSDKSHIAHPSFIHIIDRLCPDEARIIEYLVKDHALVKITIKFWDEKRESYQFILRDATGIEKKIELMFPNNTNLYFDNLCSLGIITAETFFYASMSQHFEEIRELYKKEIEEKLPENLTANDRLIRIKEEQGMFRLTDLGHLFLDACVTNNHH